MGRERCLQPNWWSLFINHNRLVLYDIKRHTFQSVLLRLLIRFSLLLLYFSLQSWIQIFFSREESQLFRMERELTYAQEITPSRTKKWCVLVQVLERRNAKKKDNGPLHRNYMVTDMKGTKVSIIVFDGCVSLFNNTLLPYKRYYVSNALVKVTPAAYKAVEYPYTWTLRRRNIVEPYLESIPPTLPCQFQYDKFSDFYQVADQDRSICIKALIVHTLPIHDENEYGSTRDLVVINQEMIPMLLRVWDDLLIDTDVNVYAKYKIPTMFVACNLKVTTHNGLSMRAKATAYCMENPPLNEEFSLTEWYEKNEAEITRLVAQVSYRDTEKLFHPPRPAEILPLDFALASIGNAKAIWTEGRISFVSGQQHFWHEACETCFTPADVDTTWKIWCPTCQELKKIIVRTDIIVYLTHGNTRIEATIKSPEVDKLLPYSGQDLYDAADKNAPLTTQVTAALHNKHIICYLKYYDRESRGVMLRRYPIVKIYTEAEVNAYEIAREAAPSVAMSAGETTIEDKGEGSSATATELNVELSNTFDEPTATKQNTKRAYSSKGNELLATVAEPIDEEEDTNDTSAQKVASKKSKGKNKVT